MKGIRETYEGLVKAGYHFGSMDSPLGNTHTHSVFHDVMVIVVDALVLENKLLKKRIEELEAKL
jgi:hypothetical protein